MRAGRRVAYALPATGGGSGDPIAWVSGAWLMHDAARVSGFGTFRDRPLGVLGVFSTRSTDPNEITNAWYMGSSCVPTGYTGAIALGLQMCANGATVEGQDVSSQMTTLANTLNSYPNTFYIRLGWEMNLNGNAWKVTDSNLTDWRSRWSTYYDIFKGIMGSKAQIGFNPNGGSNEGGTLTSTMDNAWVNGKVDWAGPDQYDDWPPFDSDSNVNTQLTRTQGLNWWASLCRTKGVPLALPEWGVSSGDQWSGHTGGDNIRYINEMYAFMRANADIMLFDSYFSDEADYLKSDMWRPSGTAANPLAGARYAQLWATP